MEPYAQNVPWKSPEIPYLLQGRDGSQTKIDQSGVSPNGSGLRNHMIEHWNADRVVQPQQFKPVSVENVLSLHVSTLLKDLQALTDGWAGPQTVPPNSIVISKLSEILCALNLKEEEMPSIQIDDDGALTLIWKISKNILCSIDILKDGKLICVYSELCDGPAKSRVFSPTNIQETVDFHRNCINRV